MVEGMSGVVIVIIINMDITIDGQMQTSRSYIGTDNDYISV